MCVAGRVAARTVLDEHTLDALSRNVRLLVLVDERHFRVFFFDVSAKLPNGKALTSNTQIKCFM
jgi:hypothetical protein